MQGLISPITSLISSPGNLLKGLLVIGASAALLILANGGAATPF
ncbi:MAG: hypothetical protein U0003_05425 [Vampirovibrionales bacterium]